MILESLVALIGWLVVKVGTDVATNIENRIINAAIDVVEQKQQPSLTTLGLYMSDLQKRQDEMKALQRRQIEEHYKSGHDLLSRAQQTGKKKYKIELIKVASLKFTEAKNLEVGKAAAEAALLIGACSHLLYCINNEYGIADENLSYDQAFQLAEQSLGPDGKPPRDLIEQLLRLPYLQEKHETFEVYWKKWEPPKLIGEMPINRHLLKAMEASEHQVTPGSHLRKCVSCGKNFYIPPSEWSPTYIQPWNALLPLHINYCPVCRSLILRS